MIDRLRRLREAVAAIGADAAIVTHPANRHYFSGFPADDHAPDESSGILVVAEESVIRAASAMLANSSSDLTARKAWNAFSTGTSRTFRTACRMPA